MQQNKKQKNNFICNVCSFTCRNKKDFNRHLSTTKHKRLILANGWLMEKTPHDISYNICDDNELVSCELSKGKIGNFTPYDKSSDDQHVENHLHTDIVIKNNFKKTPHHFSCEICGKKYIHKSSLCKHRKICFINESKIINKDNQNDSYISKENNNNFKNIILLLVKENKEIQKNFMDMLPYMKGDNNSNSFNTTYSNTTNTNHFNINMFLNDHCKNAMNLTDFINSLPITNETYDHTIENGLTKTITSMVVNGLNNMDILERPIHCTDPVRKTMYVKDNDVWEKDNELKLLLHGIKVISFKQRTNLCTWQDANNGWDKDENLQTKMTKLVYNSMMNVEDDVKETNKIIRAIGKNTYLTSNIKDEYK